MGKLVDADLADMEKRVTSIEPDPRVERWKGVDKRTLSPLASAMRFMDLYGQGERRTITGRFVNPKLENTDE